MKIFKANLYLFPISALLAAAVLSGCGGGGGSTESVAGTTVTVSSRSRAEFIQLANGICKRTRSKLLYEMGEYIKEQEGREAGGKTTLPDAFRVVGLPKFPAQIEEIRSLGAPRGHERWAEEFLASMQKVLDAPKQFTFRELSRSAALARKYGLHDCAYV